jgi:REP element-mobilizing transposase RayT
MGSDAWRAVTDRFPTIRLDAFVVMPNHIHGIVVITTTTATTVGAGLVPAHDDVPVTDRATTRVAPTLGDVIGAFKSITTVGYIRGVRTHRWPPFRGRLWQRNYYEHVIRDANSLDRIRRYILDNPRRWHQDRYNPTATRRSETPEREVPNVLREVAG